MTPEDLSQVASWLADGARTGKAKQSFRRRSISTSYYAVFHALALLCADTLAGVDKRSSDAWRSIYRALNHGPAKAALDRLASDMGDADLSLIAGAFKNLQRIRNDADYDPGVDYTMPEAVGYANQAKSTIYKISQLSDDLRLALATSLLFPQRR